MSDVGRQEEASDKHPVPASAQEPAHKRKSKRKRSDSITSISDGDSSEEPDQNFGARALVHYSKCAHLLPPMFPDDQCLEDRQYEALKKADARGDLDVRLKILKELEIASFGRRR